MRDAVKCVRVSVLIVYTSCRLCNNTEFQGTCNLLTCCFSENEFVLSFIVDLKTPFIKWQVFVMQKKLNQDKTCQNPFCHYFKSTTYKVSKIHENYLFIYLFILRGMVNTLL